MTRQIDDLLKSDKDEKKKKQGAGEPKSFGYAYQSDSSIEEPDLDREADHLDEFESLFRVRPDDKAATEA